MPDIVKRWLAAAPAGALLIVAFTAIGALGTWVWVVAAEVKDQRALAVIAAKAASDVADDTHELTLRVDRVESDTTARLTQHEGGTEARLSRIEGKVDRLLEQMAYMRSHPEEKKP